MNQDIKIINPNKNIDILNCYIRCNKCGAQWRVDIGNDNIIPSEILSCFRCLARESEDKAGERNHV